MRLCIPKSLLSFSSRYIVFTSTHLSIVSLWPKKRSIHGKNVVLEDETFHLNELKKRKERHASRESIDFRASMLETSLARKDTRVSDQTPSFYKETNIFPRGYITCEGR